MTDSLFQRLGEMRLPTKATDVDPTALTLAPLDPPRDVMLAMFAAAINFELGAAWAVAAAAVTSLPATPVADTWPGEPTPEIVLQRKCDFPCLFLSRSGLGTYSDYSLARKKLTQRWGLHYIISPVDAGDYRKIGDILVRVGAVILHTIERKGHPAYSSTGNILATTGLSILNLMAVQAGQARFAGTGDNAPLYHSLSCELESVEIANWVDGTAAPFNGAGFSFGTGDVGGVIPDFVQADTEAPIQSFPVIGPLAVGRTFP